MQNKRDDDSMDCLKSQGLWNVRKHHVLAIVLLISLCTLAGAFFAINRSFNTIGQIVSESRQNVFVVKAKDGKTKKTIIPQLTEQLKTLPDFSKCNMDKYLNHVTAQCKPLLNESRNGEVNNSRPMRYTDCDIYSVSYDCSALRYSYLYGKGNVSTDEKMFPLAFAMKIHVHPNQAHRLLRYIYQEHNLYCIHVDRKSPAGNYIMFKQIGECFDNIIVIKDRVNVVYSTIRQIDAEFKCMNAMTKHGHKWKYYINLTGQEFMLKTNLELVKILKLLNGANDILSVPSPPKKTLRRHNQSTYIIGNHSLRTKKPKSPFSENIEIRSGSAYGLFSRKFVEFILTEEIANRLYNWLNDTWAPEEHIWATLNYLPQAPGGHRAHTMSPRSFISRAVKWRSFSECGGKFVREVCIYGTKDIPWLLSSQKVVANKFYESFQSLALDCVENEMYSRLMSGVTSHHFNSSEYDMK